MGFYRSGTLTIKQLASNFKVHDRTIKRLIEKADAGVDLADRFRSGRPPILKAADHYAIGNYLKADDMMSTKQVSWKLRDQRNVSVSRTTVWRYLKSVEWISARPTKRVPLSNLQKERRIIWVNDNVHRNWKREIFSDETIFQARSNKVRVWGKSRKFVYKSRNVAKVHVWGAISHRGTVGIYFLEPGQTINSEVYCEKILADVLQPNAERLYGNDYTFQQDNAPPHVSKFTMEWFEWQNIDIMTWPANSPDLNPIENLWNWMAIELEKKRVTTVEAMKEALQEIWDGITPDFLQNYIESMPKRCQDVLEANGGSINY